MSTVGIPSALPRSTSTVNLSQHLSSIAEAARVERLEIVRLIGRYPATNPEVARALNALRAEILGRNR
jgi:hypothetical protein